MPPGQTPPSQSEPFNFWETSLKKNFAPWFLIFCVVLIAIGLAFIGYFKYQAHQSYKDGLSVVEEFQTKPRDPSLTNFTGWQTYRNEEYGFEMKLPQGWIQNGEATISEDKSIIIIGFASPEAQKSKYFDMYGGGFNVWIYNNPKFLSVSTFFDGKNSVNIFRDEAGNIVEKREILIDSKKVTRIYNFAGGMGNVELAVIDDEGRFIELESYGDPKLFDQILSTFKFTSPTLTPTPLPSDKPVVCTMEAMQCPDGSYVGRTGPNCQFVCL